MRISVTFHRQSFVPTFRNLNCHADGGQLPECSSPERILTSLVIIFTTMAVFPWIALIVFVLLIVVVIIALFTLKIRREEYEKTGKHPKGHYIGLGIALGMLPGYLIAFFIGWMLGTTAVMVSLGPALGLGIGLTFGSIWEKKHEKELRPLTEKELKIRNQSILLLSGLVVLGVLVFLAVMLLR